MSLTTTIKRGNFGPVWNKPVPDRWLCFCRNFLSFCWSSLVAFGEVVFQKIMTNGLFGILFKRQDTFYPHQDYEEKKFYKKLSLYFIRWSFRNLKIAVDLQMAQNWNFSTKSWQIVFKINNPNIFTLLCKRNIRTSGLCREKTLNLLIR